MTKKKALTLSGIILLLIILDQISKIWVRQHFVGGQQYSYLGGLLQFLHTENTGAFLSLGAAYGDALRFWIFTVGVGFFLIATTAYLFLSKSLDTAMQICLALLISGGVGNLIDRAIRGSVTDFIYMAAGPLHTGVFNIADMAVSTGVVIMFVKSIRAEKK